MRLSFNVLAAVCVLITVSACSSGGGGSESSDDGGSETPEIPQAGSFTSLCGVSVENEILNPATDGERVSVEVISSDQVAVVASDGTSRTLVKFHGVTADGVNEFRRRNGAAILSEKLAQGAILIEAGDDCPYVVDGAQAGILGQIFSLTGESMTELMLREGAVVSSPEACSGEVLASCYQTVGFVARPPSEVELDPVPVSIPSQCGAVKEGAIVNPVTTAEDVAVEVVSATEVIVTRLRGIEAGNSQAVKLQGIGTVGVPPFRAAQGAALVREQTFAGAYLVVADLGCAATLSGGVSGVFGQLYSKGGLPLNEELIRSGAAVPILDACGGNLLEACYAQIAATAPPPPDETASNEVISDFLWKPVSESTGNLAVLVNPENVRIVVNGSVTETLADTGPSNGRGTTGRGVRPGCAFGNNVRVEFFDTEGRRIFVATGEDSVTVPQGCDRFEFRL